MRAAVPDMYGPPDVLRLDYIERSVPKKDEVPLQIHAAPVSRAGLRESYSLPTSRPVVSLLSRSISGIRRPRQRILGGELTGEIEAVGPAISEFAVGEHVFGRTGFGSWRTRS